MFYLAVALAAAATVLYHVAQKSIPRGADPAVSLVMTYVTALGLAAGALTVAPRQTSLWGAVRQLNWAPYAVGVSIVLVELAFLLAYRWGWRLSIASVVSNVTTAVCLVVLGVLAFGENLAPRQLLGMGLCLGGLVLMLRG